MAPDNTIISKLTLDEKYEWVEALLVAIHAQEAREPLPEWQKQLIQERLAEFHANPNQGRPWREVLQELRDRK